LIHVQLKVKSPALRAGLTSLIGDEDDMEVVEQGTPSTEEAPTVMVVAAAGEDGGVAWDTLAPPESALLLLGDRPVALEQLRTRPGACGALPLDASAEELQAAIRALAAGLTVVAGSLLLPEADKAQNAGPLTEREVQVLGLLASGLANKQIALELGISEHTVKFHVSSIYTKLNAASRTQAVREGLRRGWIAL
jgi:DNA-binding NarL/FixJ family response regulator